MNTFEPDLSVRIKSLEMKNPVTVASGTYGQGDIFKPFYDLRILGALTTKSVTLKPRAGNPPPRIAETRSGLLNAIGLQNPGIHVFIEKYKDYLETLGTPVIMSIAGNSSEDYALLAERISNEIKISAIEINISCPNVKQGGHQFACDINAAASVVKAVRTKTSLPLITKLSPNTEQNVAIAKACIAEGTDALAVINTLKGMAISLEKRKPLLGNITGGLSGPCVKPVALRWVYELAGSVSVPIIGMGGIMNGRDALEFIAAGATAVAVGTSNFSDPLSVPRILGEIKDWLIQNKIQSLHELRNTVFRG